MSVQAVLFLFSFSFSPLRPAIKSVCLVKNKYISSTREPNFGNVNIISSAAQYVRQEIMKKHLQGFSSALT